MDRRTGKRRRRRKTHTHSTQHTTHNTQHTTHTHTHTNTHTYAHTFVFCSSELIPATGMMVTDRNTYTHLFPARAKVHLSALRRVLISRAASLPQVARSLVRGRRAHQGIWPSGIITPGRQKCTTRTPHHRVARVPKTGSRRPACTCV